MEFVALICLSYIKKQRQDAKLFERWTLQGLLDELGSIELYEVPGHGRILVEITENQEQHYRDLGCQPVFTKNTGDVGYACSTLPRHRN